MNLHELRFGEGGFSTTYEDEDPSPTSPSTMMVEEADGRGQETSECTGQRGRGEEEGEAFLCLSALVPHADQVEAVGRLTLSEKSRFDEVHVRKETYLPGNIPDSHNPKKKRVARRPE